MIALCEEIPGKDSREGFQGDSRERGRPGARPKPFRNGTTRNGTTRNGTERRRRGGEARKRARSADKRQAKNSAFRLFFLLPSASRRAKKGNQNEKEKRLGPLPLLPPLPLLCWRPWAFGLRGLAGLAVVVCPGRFLCPGWFARPLLRFRLVCCGCGCFVACCWFSRWCLPLVACLGRFLRRCRRVAALRFGCWSVLRWVLCSRCLLVRLLACRRVLRWLGSVWRFARWGLLRPLLAGWVLPSWGGRSWGAGQRAVLGRSGPRFRPVFRRCLPVWRRPCFAFVGLPWLRRRAGSAPPAPALKRPSPASVGGGLPPPCLPPWVSGPRTHPQAPKQDLGPTK